MFEVSLARSVYYCNLCVELQGYLHTMARIAAHHRKANIHYLSTHMVHQATKPEYNCLKQGERATNVHLRLREITSENSTTRRR